MTTTRLGTTEMKVEPMKGEILAPELDIEITPEMIEAGVDVLCDPEFDLAYVTREELADRIFRMMMMTKPRRT